MGPECCLGVLPFAKRGDDRGNNLVRLQQMFPRIVAADFEQPNHVTPECRHLLKRTLTADPDKRITIPEIMRHPWFQASISAIQRSVPNILSRVFYCEVSKFTAGFDGAGVASRSE